MGGSAVRMGRYCGEARWDPSGFLWGHGLWINRLRTLR